MSCRELKRKRDQQQNEEVKVADLLKSLHDEIHTMYDEDARLFSHKMLGLVDELAKLNETIALARVGGWDSTFHGSFKTVRRHIEIYSEWEKIGYFPRPFFRTNGQDFWAVLLQDEKLREISKREELEQREEYKRGIRKWDSLLFVYPYPYPVPVIAVEISFIPHLMPANSDPDAVEKNGIRDNRRCLRIASCQFNLSRIPDYFQNLRGIRN